MGSDGRVAPPEPSWREGTLTYGEGRLTLLDRVISLTELEDGTTCALGRIGDLAASVRVGARPMTPILEVEIRMWNDGMTALPMPGVFAAEGLVALASGDSLVRTAPGSTLPPYATDRVGLALALGPDGDALQGRITLVKENGRITLFSEEPLLGARLFIGDGRRTLETSLDLAPGQPVAMTLPSDDFHEFAVEIDGKREILVAPAEPPFVSGPDLRDPERDVAHPALRAAALVAQARRIATTDATKAGELVERALLTSGDHPDLWAFRAILARHAREDDHPALENLAFLVPTHPVLRTERALLGGDATQLSPAEWGWALAPYLRADLLSDAIPLIELARRDAPCPDVARVAASLSDHQGLAVDAAALRAQAGDGGATVFDWDGYPELADYR